MSHLSLAAELDLVTNGSSLRLIPFLVQVLKIKALGNVSPENEQKKIEVKQYFLSSCLLSKTQSPSAKMWRIGGPLSMSRCFPFFPPHLQKDVNSSQMIIIDP